MVMLQQTMTPATRTIKCARPSSLSRAALLRMANAGVMAVDCIQELHEDGTNLVIEALRGSDFTEWEHYPSNDVHDPRSHAQYYFHAHPPNDRDVPDYGHFHTFMRPKGMPGGICPAELVGVAPPEDESNAVSHLIAISMTPAGLPERLFTTNRWVTGETWYRSSDVIEMLDRFTVNLDHPSLLLNQWLTAMLVLFRPQIEELLIGRDRAVESWHAHHSTDDVFEDRRLEITSSMEISLYEHIEWLDGQLETVART